MKFVSYESIVTIIKLEASILPETSSLRRCHGGLLVFDSLTILAAVPTAVVVALIATCTVVLASTAVSVDDWHPTP